MESFVARQPIFLEDLSVFGYEILVSSGLEDACSEIDPDQASAKVVADSSFLFGVRTITGGKKAFIPFTRELIVEKYVQLLPQDLAAVEISGMEAPGPDLIEACRSLKQAGYLLVLDDFREAGEPLLDLVEIVKIDVRATNEEQQRRLLQCLSSGRSIRFLAEKVETREAFELAVKMGYALFQGHFFRAPEVLSRRDIPAHKVNYLQILRAINEPDMEFDAVAEIIKREVSLAYKLLRFVNSVHFGWRRKIESIRRALVMLGENETRKWVSLTVLAGVSDAKPDELVIQSVIRARFCETLAPLAKLEERSQDLFLLGLFSMLDVILDRPLGELIEELPISEDVKEALLTGDNRLRSVLECVLAYERGEWSRVLTQSSLLGVDEKAVPQLYLDTVEWCNQVFA